MTLRPTTVLVVDDDEGVRTVLRRALEEYKYRVLTASSGQEALDILARTDVEVMLLDIRMPGLSGLDVLRQAQANHPATGVVIVTAAAETQTAVEAMKAGAYDYVTKPINPDEVPEQVRKAYERRNLQLRNKAYQEIQEQRAREQAERLKEQFAQLIQSLAREHSLVLHLEASHLAKKKKGAGSSLPPELQKPVGSVDEFVKALFQVLAKHPKKD